MEPPSSSIHIHLKHEMVSALQPTVFSPPAVPRPVVLRGVCALMVLLAFSLCHACSIGSCKLLQSNVICCGSCSCFQVQSLILSCLSYTVQLIMFCSELPASFDSYLPVTQWILFTGQAKQFLLCWLLAYSVFLCPLVTCSDMVK